MKFSRVSPEVEAIIDAWLLEDTQKAIVLTAEFAVKQRKCAHCGKLLAPQNKGGYCKQHRSHNPERKKQVKRSKKNER